MCISLYMYESVLGSGARGLMSWMSRSLREFLLLFVYADHKCTCTQAYFVFSEADKELCLRMKIVPDGRCGCINGRRRLFDNAHANVAVTYSSNVNEHLAGGET